MSMSFTRRHGLLVLVSLLVPFTLSVCALAQDVDDPQQWIEDHYVKSEHDVPMRDGVRLFTIVYEPRDQSQTYPVMLFRTPYSIRPYGEDAYRSSLGPNFRYAQDGFIFVYQDVRGKYMSEGEFVNMRPHIAEKQSEVDVDESSDTYDTVEWVLANIPNHNGKVGQWGISYPGFYTAAGMIDHHPALRAVSPQAPIADWWYDDFHHHGAFFLPHAFGFLSSFGQPRPEPTTRGGRRDFEFWTPDGYAFYLDMGPLKNANERYLKGKIDFWNQLVAHPNRDAFWQARDILPHLHDVPPAVMTVGGWFDAEDLYGPLNIYREAEQNNPDVFNIIVMGPWVHGGWNRASGESVGNVHFDAATSAFYREHIEWPFFQHFLKGKGELDLPEAMMFETGVNEWRRFEQWPPAEAQPTEFFMRAGSGLSMTPPTSDEAPYAEYISDPDTPVPFTEAIARGMTREYMTDDQRFAGRRPDVLVFQTDVLEEELTLAGPIIADLWVSTSGTDSDWIVKVIDVFPHDHPDYDDTPDGMRMAGYQMMVRSEVIRGRFRNDPARPEPFTPNRPTRVVLPLQDVLHTFKPGHRLMVQIQSTWFPLVDRNPQTFVENIFLAEEDDFITATQRVFHGPAHASRLKVLRLRD